jgi:hypothetical protein
MAYVKRTDLLTATAGQLPVAPTYKGRKDVTGIIGNVVSVTSGFPYATELRPKLSAIWVRDLRIGCQPCSKPK